MTNKVQTMATKKAATMALPLLGSGPMALF